VAETLTPSTLTTSTLTTWDTAVASWQQALGCLSAAALIARPPEWAPVRPEVLDAARAVLDAAGLDPAQAPPAEQITGPLAQAAAITGPVGFDWLDQPDAALLAQGRMSGHGARLAARHVLARLDGLTQRLNRPGAAILDVGTGVATLATALAEQFPTATVTGLDVSEQVLALAHTELAGHPASDRVRLRCQDVATLDEREAYDLAWIPAPFMAPAALTAGVTAMAAALRPRGWLLLGHGDLPLDRPLDAAVTRLITAAWGGTALTSDDAANLLTAAGLTDVTPVGAVPRAPSMTAARRP